MQEPDTTLADKPIHDLEEQVAIPETPAKAAAFLPDSTKPIAGVRFYAFSGGRKNLLAAIGNEYYRARFHIQKFIRASGFAALWWPDYKADRLAIMDDAVAEAQSNPDKTEADILELERLYQRRARFAERGAPKRYDDIADDYEFQTMAEACIPQCTYHLAGLAFICCHSPDELADLTVDAREFRRAVVRWTDKFNSKQLQDVYSEAVRRYVDENIGADFEVVATDGSPPRPN